MKLFFSSHSSLQVFLLSEKPKPMWTCVIGFDFISWTGSAQQGESGGTTGSAVSHCCRGGTTNSWSHGAGGRGAGGGETFEWTQEVNGSFLGNSNKPLLASLAAATSVPTPFVPVAVTFVELPPQAFATVRWSAQLPLQCLIVVFSSVDAIDQRSQSLHTWQGHLHIVE